MANFWPKLSASSCVSDSWNLDKFVIRSFLPTFDHLLLLKSLFCKTRTFLLYLIDLFTSFHSCFCRWLPVMPYGKEWLLLIPVLNLSKIHGHMEGKYGVTIWRACVSIDEYDTTDYIIKNHHEHNIFVIDEWINHETGSYCKCRYMQNYLYILYSSV